MLAGFGNSANQDFNATRQLPITNPMYMQQYQLPPWAPQSLNMGWTPAQHTMHANMQLPTAFQLSGREGESERANAYARYMRNQGNPNIAIALAQGGTPGGGYSSFRQSAVRDATQAQTQSANEYADDARSRAIQDKIALRNAYMGVPTPAAPTGMQAPMSAYSQRYAPGGGSSQSPMGSGLMSILRGAYNLAAPSVSQNGLLPTLANLPGRVGGLLFGRPGL